MLVYLNGQRNMIIIPKETLEELGNPRYFQLSVDMDYFILKYSDQKMPGAAVVDYPLPTNSVCLQNEKMAKACRRHYKWGDNLYMVDAVPYRGALVIDPEKSEKTEIPNKGL